MSDASDDLVCPECGGPIGMTATYCMHCSADLTDESTAGGSSATWSETPGVEEAWRDEDEVEDWREDDRTDADGPEDGDAAATRGDLPPEYRSTGYRGSPELLPDGFAVKALTFVLAIVGGFAAGIGSALALATVTVNSNAFLVGVIVWFAATAGFLRVVPG